MNKITQYIPNFITTDVIPEEYEFDTIEQLLQIEFVKKFSSDFDFYRYSQDISSDYINEKNLILISDEDFKQKISDFYEKFLHEQKLLEVEFEKVLFDNLWDMLES